MNSSGIPGMALHQAISFFSPMMSVPETPAVFWPGCALLNLDPAILKKTLEILARTEPEIRLAAGCCGQPSFFLFPEKKPGKQGNAGTPAEKKRGKKDLHRLSQLHPPASWDLRDPGDPHLVCPGRDHDPEGSLRTRKCTPGSRRNNAWLYLARSLPHPERSGRTAGGPGPFTPFRRPGHGAGAYRPPDPVLRKLPYDAHPGAGKKRPDAGAAAGRISGGPDRTEQLPGLPWLL